MSAARRESNSDRIAVQAAILMQSGQAQRISDAIRRAAETLGIEDGPMPSFASVRKHAQAMAMQSMGDAAYHESRRAILQVAENIMTVLEHAGIQSLLMGRAAAGNLDADVKLHLRVFTDEPIGELAQRLVDFGYEEPQFDTVDTMYGRLDRMSLTEEGVAIALTRCPPILNIDPHVDLFTGKAIASATIDELRRRINE